MRKLSTIQKREKLNDVYAVDERGVENACHQYNIGIAETGKLLVYIQFQNGARKKEDSVEGVLDTDLLEIVRDRLQGFQSGDFRTRENACALTHIEEALMWLNKRIEEQIERDVLGTEII